MTTDTQKRARYRYKWRRVINGHTYDTETASCLAWWYCTEYGPNAGEDLYVNVHGHYFILRHDEDELSQWAESEEQQEDRFFKLTPLTRIEAIQWAEKYCNRQVEELFGRMPEPGEGEAYTPIAGTA